MTATNKYLKPEAAELYVPTYVPWADLFDRIYVVHYALHTDRLHSLHEEMRRVNMPLDMVEIRTTYPTKYDDFVIRSVRPEPNSGPRPAGLASLARETIMILKDAQFKNYKRILIMENDIRFLRDLDELTRRLNDTPDVGIVRYDKFVAPGMTKDFQKRSDPNGKDAYNSSFFDPKDGCFYSGACYAVSHDAYEPLCNELERYPQAPDSAFGKLKDVKQAVATKNLAIQLVFPGSISASHFGVDSHHNGYRDGGIQDYSEYAVPKYYEMGRVVGCNRPDHLKIVVYAITKNEAKFVDRWYESMKEADEIYVLDTGSTDDTIQRLRAYPKVTVETAEFHPWKTVAEYHELEAQGKRPWRFDVARNLSIDIIPEDADILVCTDLDEILVAGWREKLENTWADAIAKGQQPTTGAYEYVWSFQPDGSDGKKFTYEKVHTRTAGRWTHPVHEILGYSGVTQVTIDIPGMRLEHYPDPGKSRSNYLPMLELSIEEAPEDDRNTHYLGREYTFVHRWDDAIAMLKHHLEMPSAVWRAERAASMRYIAYSYSQLGDLDAAELWYRRACDEEPGQREAPVDLAQFLYHNNPSTHWPAIVAACERALRTTERSGSYITEPYAWGPMPHDLLSLAYWHLGRNSEALEQAKAALKLSPNDKRLQNNMQFMAAASTMA